MKKADIARSFSLATRTYDQHAFVQKEIGQRLLERIAIVKNAPDLILDIGAGTGYLTRQLQQQFPKSDIIGLDLAHGMTHYAKTRQPWPVWGKKPSYLCADTEALPLKSQSVDIIFSNFTLQWCFDLAKVFAEFKRVLKPNGMIFFSTLGPKTLQELRASWAMVDNYSHVNQFLDMHDIGDLLLNSQFDSPVIDMEMVTVAYQDVKQLLKDLKATGAHTVQGERTRGLTSKQSLLAMIKAYETFKQPNNRYPATFEVVYGHAIKLEKMTYKQDDEGVVKIPADKIPILKEIIG